MAAALSKAEQYKRTRRALLDAACEFFAEHGYEATSTAELVRSIGMTRGALYFHFRDKTDLFAAAYQEQRVALAHTIAARLQTVKGAPWRRVIATACQAFVDSAMDPKVRRILFVDGPAVMDREVVREPEPALLVLRNVLEPLMDESEVDPLPLDPFVHVFWAACLEAGIYIVNAADSAAARKEMLGTLESLITGMWLSPRLD